jgi:acyl-CoA dehydrogenase
VATLIERAERVADDVVATNADAVDRDARFPKEAVDALRAEGLLSVLVPRELGGESATVGDVAAVVTVLSRACASTGMIYAMHQIQVACLVRHGDAPAIREYLRELAANHWLLASATTEMGVGGDVRTSICAVERDGGRFHLEKDSPVISYGEYADGVLATARRSPDAPGSDQVLVLCAAPGLSLRAKGEWDTLGFRGTCSLGFDLVADGDESLVLPVPYSEISSQTMLPTSHVVWASVWLGIADAAVSRARELIRKEARKKPGTTPPAAMHLADLVAVHQQLTELVRGAARRYDELADDPEALTSMSFAISMNALKVSASRLVVDIVHQAMGILGMSGYRNDSPLSLGRLLRDAHGAALMVNNDRINANNAQMLLISRD